MTSNHRFPCHFICHTLLPVWVLALLSTTALSAAPRLERTIASLDGATTFLATRGPKGWGLAVRGAGAASVTQVEPIALEFYRPPDSIVRSSYGYDRLIRRAGGAVCTANIRGPDGSSFTVVDRWTISGSQIRLDRTLRVSGRSSQGFQSAILWSHPQVHERSDVDYFAPGMIYGGTDHLSVAAIGGADTYGERGLGEVQIREDRLPAPLFGVHFPDGSALTLLDPSPDGTTTRSDSHDTLLQALIDKRYSFGALGVHLDAGHQAQGFWFPGSEGEVTYTGTSYPGGQLHAWRRRYHPIEEGFIQHYAVDMRFSRAQPFSAYFRDAWRWAYETLKPPVLWQDLPLIQRSLIDLLANQAITVDHRTGIPNAVSATAAETTPPKPNAILGFTGKNLEAAEFLLADSQTDADPVRAGRDRMLGLAIFRSFTQMSVSPPNAEGFDIRTGAPLLAIPLHRRIYLRSFSDDMKATLRAYRREKSHGVSHPNWLAWASRFADWLLTQQQPAGGFPRSWVPGTGAVADPSPASSYNPVPFLVLLSQESGNDAYLVAAKRAAEFAWSQGQSAGRFVGGTIDNPDILDKEAGTLSLEAYVHLFAVTHQAIWLERARAAADYSETYIYLWNVPMLEDQHDADLQWKRLVPTYGLQLIATGHSLTDEYMACAVDDYARLGQWTGDPHYLALATLLLHDTKSMIALPGRKFDLKGPGWQQEHWSMAPIRGFGLHRLWLPWVATSQLKGQFGLQDFDPELYRRLSLPTDTQAASASGIASIHPRSTRLNPVSPAYFGRTLACTPAAECPR